jgi:glycerol-3-phosphate dehydrogenase (NAD(P)+)
MSTKKQYKICVLGAGSYGTAMAFVAGQQGHQVSLWMRREEVAKAIRETGFHPQRFSESKIPKTVKATSDIDEALRGKH